MSKLKLPIVILNFKTYLEATGVSALNLSEISREAARRTGVSIAIAPQFTDIAATAKDVAEVPVLAQHFDPVKPGSCTGHILAEAVKEAGAVGSLLNHSERRLPLKDVESCIARARELELTTVVCADTPQTCGQVASLKPDLIAIEPPELIGTGIPVSKAKPEVVTESVKVVGTIDPEIPVLCGAGISAGEDVAAALRLGAKGVLLASGVVKAKKPLAVLLEMADSIMR